MDLYICPWQKPWQSFCLSFLLFFLYCLITDVVILFQNNKNILTLHVTFFIRPASVSWKQRGRKRGREREGERERENFPKIKHWFTALFYCQLGDATGLQKLSVFRWCPSGSRFATHRNYIDVKSWVWCFLTLFFNLCYPPDKTCFETAGSFQFSLDMYLDISNFVCIKYHVPSVWICVQLSHCSGKRFVLHPYLSPFLTGRMFVRRTYFGQFDELWFVS